MERIELDFEADEGDVLAGIEAMILQLKRLEEAYEDAEAAADSMGTTVGKKWRAGGAGGGGTWEPAAYAMGPAGSTPSLGLMGGGGNSAAAFKLQRERLQADASELRAVKNRTQLLEEVNRAWRAAAVGLPQLGPGPFVPAAPTGPSSPVGGGPPSLGPFEMGRYDTRRNVGTLGEFGDSPLQVDRSAGIAAAERYLRSRGHTFVPGDENSPSRGGAIFGGAGFGERGGGGGGGFFALRGKNDGIPQPGDLVRGILPGAGRAGPGALGLLAGGALGGANLLAPAALGLGVGAAAGIGLMVTNVSALALAFRGLGDAIGGDAKAYEKLLPYQKEFVNQVRSFMPFVDRLQKVVAQGVLPGAAAGLQAAMSPAMQGALTSGLGAVGEGLGDQFQKVGEFVGSDEQAAKFEAFLKNSVGWTDSLTDAVLSLFDAFTTLLDVGAPFITWMNDGIAAGAEWVNALIDQKTATGELGEQFEKAEDVIRTIGDALGSLIGFLRAVADTMDGPVGLALELIGDGLDSLADTIVRNQDEIAAFIEGGIKALATAIEIIFPLLTTLVQLLNDVAEAVGGWETAFKLILAGVLVSKVNALAGTFTLLAGTSTTGILGASTVAGGLLGKLGMLAKMGAIVISVDIVTGGKGSDLLGWFFKEGAEVGDAVNRAARRVGIPLPENTVDPDGTPRKKPPTPTQKPLMTKTDTWLSNPRARFVADGDDVKVQGPDGTVWHTYDGDDKSLAAAAARNRAEVDGSKQAAAATTYAKGRARTASVAAAAPKKSTAEKPPPYDDPPLRGDDLLTFPEREQLAKAEGTVEDKSDDKVALRSIIKRLTGSLAGMPQGEGRALVAEKIADLKKELATASKEVVQAAEDIITDHERELLAKAERSPGNKDDISVRSRITKRLLGELKGAGGDRRADIQETITKLKKESQSVLGAVGEIITANERSLLAIAERTPGTGDDVSVREKIIKRLFGQLRGATGDLRADIQEEITDLKKEIEDATEDTSKAMLEAIRKLLDTTTIANELDKVQSFTLGVKHTDQFGEAFADRLRNILGGDEKDDSGEKRKTPAGMGGGVGWPGRIKFMAEGGIAASPTLAVIGERGPEAVIPLSNPRARGMMGGGTEVNVQIADGMSWLKDFVRVQIEDSTDDISYALNQRVDERVRGGRF